MRYFAAAILCITTISTSANAQTTSDIVCNRGYITKLRVSEHLSFEGYKTVESILIQTDSSGFVQPNGYGYYTDSDGQVWTALIGTNSAGPALSRAVDSLTRAQINRLPIRINIHRYLTDAGSGACTWNADALAIQICSSESECN